MVINRNRGKLVITCHIVTTSTLMSILCTDINTSIDIEMYIDDFKIHTPTGLISIT